MPDEQKVLDRDWIHWTYLSLPTSKQPNAKPVEVPSVPCVHKREFPKITTEIILQNLPDIDGHPLQPQNLNVKEVIRALERAEVSGELNPLPKAQNRNTYSFLEWIVFSPKEAGRLKFWKKKQKENTPPVDFNPLTTSGEFIIDRSLLAPEKKIEEEEEPEKEESGSDGENDPPEDDDSEDDSDKEPDRPERPEAVEAEPEPPISRLRLLGQWLLNTVLPNLARGAANIYLPGSLWYLPSTYTPKALVITLEVGRIYLYTTSGIQFFFNDDDKPSTKLDKKLTPYLGRYLVKVPAGTALLYLDGLKFTRFLGQKASQYTGIELVDFWKDAEEKYRKSAEERQEIIKAFEAKPLLARLDQLTHIKKFQMGLCFDMHEYFMIYGYPSTGYEGNLCVEPQYGPRPKLPGWDYMAKVFHPDNIERHIPDYFGRVTTPYDRITYQIYFSPLHFSSDLKPLKILGLTHKKALVQLTSPYAHTEATAYALLHKEMELEDESPKLAHLRIRLAQEAVALASNIESGAIASNLSSLVSAQSLSYHETDLLLAHMVSISRSELNHLIQRFGSKDLQLQLRLLKRYQSFRFRFVNKYPEWFTKVDATIPSHIQPRALKEEAFVRDIVSTQEDEFRKKLNDSRSEVKKEFRIKLETALAEAEKAFKESLKKAMTDVDPAHKEDLEKSMKKTEEQFREKLRKASAKAESSRLFSTQESAETSHIEANFWIIEEEISKSNFLVARALLDYLEERAEKELARLIESYDNSSMHYALRRLNYFSGFRGFVMGSKSAGELDHPPEKLKKEALAISEAALADSLRFADPEVVNNSTTSVNATASATSTVEKTTATTVTPSVVETSTHSTSVQPTVTASPIPKKQPEPSSLKNVLVDEVTSHSDDLSAFDLDEVW
ncbi:hypothetical protein [Endozoicomonas arenosclerae]|uniref:hypothetical protein n=1 Tax=Endozoicomonas arenosclerae TaxID=1633495 RepID=UPI0012946C67|nr:hypothetical protein [Endozoicomonas arenosclerae]